ncbi:hypothetical protein P7K49_007110 [Saguinus oedipus]|uniref:Uncharacterized protein n=1 Tax=Saguinus oedipus TaxID=9490 RepID=A0ABQ9VTX9_SAGOE|nr:hypothetical protein P7K49_007110 [Saguinus oedipus]
MSTLLVAVTLQGFCLFNDTGILAQENKALCMYIYGERQRTLSSFCRKRFIATSSTILLQSVPHGRVIILPKEVQPGREPRQPPATSEHDRFPFLRFYKIASQQYAFDQLRIYFSAIADSARVPVSPPDTGTVGYELSLGHTPPSLTAAAEKGRVTPQSNNVLLDGLERAKDVGDTMREAHATA